MYIFDNDYIKQREREREREKLRKNMLYINE